MIRLVQCLMLCLAVLARPAQAATGAEPGDLCLRAADAAAAATGVPAPWLRAILLAETGQRRGGQLRPWPWALNTGGTGHWLPDRAAALAALHQQIAAGQRNVDIGCFQINLHWHGAAFATPAAMLDPADNALHAARFLKQLHGETRDWHIAAGHYHSRTPALAAAYRERLARLMPAAVQAAAAPPAGPVPLISGLAAAAQPVAAAPGSLFPAQPPGAGLGW